MLVTTQAPTGTASALALYPLSTHILAGASTAFTVKAADQNGYAANVPANIAFSADEAIGTITQDGTFTAGSTAGAGLVTVSAGGLTSSSVTVSVVETPDSITVSAEDTAAPSPLYPWSREKPSI